LAKYKLANRLKIDIANFWFKVCYPDLLIECNSKN
jgi:hypothetical protein